MNAENLRDRTKHFSLRFIRLVDALPKTTAGRVIGNQIIRSGTSVGANYRAVCRARSRAEFISKLGIVIEEADETVFWLELIVESRLVSKELIEPLLTETHELVSIFVSSSKTAKANHHS